MEWEDLADERVVCPAPGANEYTSRMLRSAWDSVVEARSAYLAAQWERADSQIRTAICIATEALVGYHGWRLSKTCEFDTARRIGAEYFGSRLTEPMFERACILRGMLPLGREIDDSEAREVRRSVAASSEYVALVESFTYRP